MLDPALESLELSTGLKPYETSNSSTPAGVGLGIPDRDDVPRIRSKLLDKERLRFFCSDWAK